MATPFKVLGAVGSTGVSSQSFNVGTSTAAGDSLVITVGVGGSSPPTVTSVTDSKSNTYALAKSVAASSPFIYVFTATGSTAALSSVTPDTITVHFSGNTTGAFGIVAADAGSGVSVLDVAASGTGSSTTASAAGTPAVSGETAFGCFVSAAASLGTTVNSPLTLLDQEQSAGSVFTTVGYDVGPASGTLLTASAALASSAAWRAVLITLEPSASTPATFTAPSTSSRGRSARRGSSSSSRGAPVSAGPPVTPSLFSAPPSSSRGRSGARRGSSSSSRGAPVLPPPPTPSPFRIPQRSSRPTIKPRRGSSSSSRGAPVTAPPVAPTLLVAIAAKAGSDDYGNSFPQGIQVGPDGPPQIALLPGPSGGASEVQFPIGNASPALSNVANIAAALNGVLAQLVVSGPASGHSSDKDWVQQVLFANDTAGNDARMEFRYISNAQAVTVTASYDSGGWTFDTAVTFDQAVECANGLQVDGNPVTINQQTTVNANTFLNGQLSVDGNAFIGDGSTLANLNLNPAMAIPPNSPTSGKTLAQTQACLDGLITSLQNHGLMT